jgi:phage-related protein (TIGR01555 family)
MNFEKTIEKKFGGLKRKTTTLLTKFVGSEFLGNTCEEVVSNVSRVKKIVSARRHKVIGKLTRAAKGDSHKLGLITKANLNFTGIFDKVCDSYEVRKRAQDQVHNRTASDVSGSKKVNKEAKTSQETLNVAYFNPNDIRRFLPEHLNESGEMVVSDSFSNASSVNDTGAFSSNLGGCGSGVDVPALNYFCSPQRIPYDLSALLAAQSPLIDKLCSIPAKDCLKNGITFRVNEKNGESDPAILDFVGRKNKKYGLLKELQEFVRMGRVFGIRHCLFMVNSSDPEYYYKPFNIHSVMPGSFTGMSQIDPTWLEPRVSGIDITDVMRKGFYEPEHWSVPSSMQGRHSGGPLIHKSHFAIYVYHPVADSLKDLYRFGGPSLPQLVYDRVHKVEKILNEIPKLVLSKRILALTLDKQAYKAEGIDVETSIQRQLDNLSNEAMVILDSTSEERLDKTETNLNDLDPAVMVEWQDIAAKGNMPTTKLIGTSAKGFQATGEYDMKNYYDELQSIQNHDLSPLIEKYIKLVVKSDIFPVFAKKVTVGFNFNPLESASGLEQEQERKLETDSDVSLIASGIVSTEEVRQKVTSDSNSGFEGLDPETMPEPPADNYE